MKNVDISTFPELSTKRLKLRRLNTGDKTEIFAIRSDPEIAKFLNRQPCKSEEEATDFIQSINEGIKKNESYYWAISFKNEQKLMGTICLWNFSKDRKTAEIGFEILPHFQGKGIMREALGEIIRFSFKELNLYYIEGEVDRENKRSIRLLEKNNFKIKDETGNEKDKETVIYRLSRD